MKKNYVLTAVVALIMLLVCAATAFAAAPNGTVTYANPTATTVDITVTFQDAGGTYSKVQSATAMQTTGDDLSWGANMTITTNAPYKSVTISAANKYMNYYVRIANPALTETRVVRIYPVTTGGASGRVDNSFVHGSVPDNCAACHDTHDSLMAKLINKASYYELCMMCHSSANTQSKYDVEGGLVAVYGGVQPSPAGPFVGLQGNATVSSHAANDIGGAIPAAVPGSLLGGTNNLGLNCTSCHAFHNDATDNYRLLKKTIYADDAKSFVTNNVSVSAYAITPNATTGESVSWISGNTEFCSSCHSDYDNGNATTPGGVYAPPPLNDPHSSPLSNTRYRHPVSVSTASTTNYSVVKNDGSRNPAYSPASGDVLPLQYNSSQTGIADRRTAVVCSTCHFAHGGTKSFNSQNSTTDGKYMLRLENYGVCESCHKK